jgi:hypothetical protein
LPAHAVILNLGAAQAARALIVVEGEVSTMALAKLLRRLGVEPPMRGVRVDDDLERHMALKSLTDHVDVVAHEGEPCKLAIRPALPGNRADNHPHLDEVL